MVHNSEEYIKNRIRILKHEKDLLEERIKVSSELRTVQEQLEYYKNKTMKKQVTLSIELAKDMYSQGGIAKAFALENYSEEELTKKALPKSWEGLNTVKGYYLEKECDVSATYGRVRSNDDNKNVYPTKELAEASLALCQLLQLKDRYNGDWKPNWRNGNELKYVICCKSGIPNKSTAIRFSAIMSFKTLELRDEFFKNFKDLLEIAKPLL